jgi:hypothetical protein
VTASSPSARPATGGRLLLIAAVLLSSFALGVPTADAAARSCKPVVNPYPNTRYDGVDLSRIRATGVSCRVARRVARRAHHKALGLTPPPSGIKRFNWRGWRVTGNLRGSSDRYVAARGAKRVRWRF